MLSGAGSQISSSGMPSFQSFSASTQAVSVSARLSTKGYERLISASAPAMVLEADAQTFAAHELFEPIGITAGNWSWARDAAWNTYGYAWLAMAPRRKPRP